MEAHFSLFGDSGNLDARLVHNLHRTYHRLRKSLWTHRMELLGYMGRVESRFGLFGDSISVGSRKVHGLHQTYRRPTNRFGYT
jgi:hypothetical protein